MAVYGVATLPLIGMLEDQNLSHKGHADHGRVAGSLESLRFALDNFDENGGALRSNVIKFHLIIKPELIQKAHKVFRDQMLMLVNVIEFWVQLMVLTKTATILRRKKSVNYSNMLREAGQT